MCVCERGEMIQVCCTFQVVAAEGSRSSDYVYLNWIVQWSLVLSTCFAFDEFLPIIIRLPQRSVDLHPVGYTEQPNIKKQNLRPLMDTLELATDTFDSEAIKGI